MPCGLLRPGGRRQRLPQPRTCVQSRGRWLPISPPGRTPRDPGGGAERAATVRPPACPAKGNQAGEGDLRGALAAPTEVGPLLEEAFRVEAAGWKGRAGTALLHDP